MADELPGILSIVCLVDYLEKIASYTRPHTMTDHIHGTIISGLVSLLMNEITQGIGYVSEEGSDMRE